MNAIHVSECLNQFKNLPWLVRLSVSGVLPIIGNSFDLNLNIFNFPCTVFLWQFVFDWEFFWFCEISRHFENFRFFPICLHTSKRSSLPKNIFLIFFSSQVAFLIISCLFSLGKLSGTLLCQNQNQRYWFHIFCANLTCQRHIKQVSHTVTDSPQRKKNVHSACFISNVYRATHSLNVWDQEYGRPTYELKELFQNPIDSNPENQRKLWNIYWHLSNWWYAMFTTIELSKGAFI